MIIPQNNTEDNSTRTAMIHVKASNEHMLIESSAHDTKVGRVRPFVNCLQLFVEHILVM